MVESLLVVADLPHTPIRVIAFLYSMRNPVLVSAFPEWLATDIEDGRGEQIAIFELLHVHHWSSILLRTFNTIFYWIKVEYLPILSSSSRRLLSNLYPIFKELQ
mmetsp:Transcript_24239/g.23832  ORF Transcript_24239/g.23832 Transcript_24239/m.23832 type:complete len:104 (+) Transcript_24239:179-490(+)